MLKVFYEDQDVIVVKKPVGTESQAVHSFAPDMVSEIKKHIHRLSTENGEKLVEDYVGVIHRLDKPVSGVMVYAKTKRAAAALSEQVQSHKMKKIYTAVVHGRPVNMVDNYVDYLVKTPDGNYSQVVDKGITGAKKAELDYRVVDTAEKEGQELSLVEIHLKTGRHHQIRVQMAHAGMPLLGDQRYGSEESREVSMQLGIRTIRLQAVKLAFCHPTSGKRVCYELTDKLTL